MRKRHIAPAQPPRRRAAPDAGRFLRGSSDEPFSRVVAVDRLRADVVNEITITADEDERAALARTDSLVRIDRLEGRFRVARHAAGVQVTGKVEAEIVQTCVVSLEPFPAVVREPVDVRFVPEAEVDALEAAFARSSGDAFADVADAADFPDPIIDGRIDLGALASEFLALGLDPHPRKPGATFAAEAAAADAGDATNVSPFVVLRPRGEKT